ncbi:MAG: HIT family protein [Desulfomonile sp.]|jgi:histidine triad (HIT) family protein|nr:HIT family protein [Deltaproteobacteria bacterium]
MRVSKECIFCRIVAGEVPCTKIFEDDSILAFMDIAPLNKGHFLVIPKEHYGNILETPPDLYGRLASMVAIIARVVQETVSPDGMNFMQLNGKAGNQVVPHLHMHLVPRWVEDGLTICAWEPIMGDIKDISATAEKIKSKLSLQR